MTLKQRPAIRISSVSKEYRLGMMHARSLRDLAENAFSLLSRKGQPANPVASKSNDRIDGEHFWALRDIDCEIKAGEAVGLIGKNGAGKSTLLKLISRITYPTSGRIELYGRVACLLEVGTGFHPELTGRENIYLNGAILGMTRREVSRQLDEIVNFSGVESFLDTPVKRYSSGMTVRLGFAVAAHLDPEILIVDEVLAVGDIEFQTRCINKMRSVAETGQTVLFVSHNLSSIRALTKRAIVLSDGRIEFDGSTSDGVAHYLNNSLVDQEAAIDLRAVKRTMSNLDSSLKLTSIELDGLDETGSLVFGTPFTLKFSLASEKGLSRIEFVVRLSIYTDGYIPIAKSNSMPIEWAGHSINADFMIRGSFPLAAGSYRCAIAIVNARNHSLVYDALRDILLFRVSDSGIPADSPARKTNYDSGSVTLDPLVAVY